MPTPAKPHPSDTANDLLRKAVVNLRLLCIKQGVECGDVCACQSNDEQYMAKIVTLTGRLVEE